MEEAQKEGQKKVPFNHVLEVQNGIIDVRDLIKHFDKNLSKVLKEKEDGG